jgi:hypothetical protein
MGPFREFHGLELGKKSEKPRPIIRTAVTFSPPTDPKHVRPCDRSLAGQLDGFLNALPADDQT